jgi:hypothetical protein
MSSKKIESPLCFKIIETERVAKGVSNAEKAGVSYVTVLSPLSFHPTRDYTGEWPIEHFPFGLKNSSEPNLSESENLVDDHTISTAILTEMRSAVKQMTDLHDMYEENYEPNNRMASIDSNGKALRPQGQFSGVSATIVEEAWSEEKAFADPCAADSPPSEPTAAYATFRDDLNIFKIHEAIRARYCFKLANIKEVESDIEKLKARLRNEKITIVECTTLTRLIAEMIEENKKTRDLEGWKAYLSNVKELLQSYAKLTSVNSVRGTVIFGNGTPESHAAPIDTEDIKFQRQITIHKYLRFASDHIEIHAFPSGSGKTYCPVCNASLEDATFSEEHGTYVCSCGRETIGATRMSTFRDSARVDTGVKNSYEDLANFIKRIDAFEGKQRTQPPEILYNQLEEYFLSNPLDSGKTPAQIRDDPLTHSGKKEGTSIALLGEALLQTSNSAFYRDSELIAHRLWGWKLPDLSVGNIRRQIINDYVETQKVYEEIKERESSLNVNLRLFFHLRARDYPCELTDFKVVSSRDSLEYHQKMMSEMCRRCGLKFTPIL